MRASEYAKQLGCKSLEQVSEFSGYTVATLCTYYKSKPKRFKGLCMATFCDDLNLTAEQMRAAKTLLKGTK